MKRKLYMFALAVVMLAISASVVHAGVNISLDITSNGVSIKNESIPLNTHANVTITYSNTNGQSSNGTLNVFYKSHPNNSWTFKQTLFEGPTPNGFTEDVPYTFVTPGYFKFEWTVERTINEDKMVHVKVGPVLPEPGTLAGLAISVAAVGLFFAKKRLTK